MDEESGREDGTSTIGELEGKDRIPGKVKGLRLGQKFATEILSCQSRRLGYYDRVIYKGMLDCA
jgi:hypothetical protein